MSPRTGRPTDNPKTHQVMVRLDEETEAIIKAYCEQENVTRAEAMRRGARTLKDEIKK